MQKQQQQHDEEAMKAAAAGIDIIDGHNGISTTCGRSGGGLMVDYMPNNTPINSTMIIPADSSSGVGAGNNMCAVERTLSFADVMQFAELGPKLALLHHNHHLIPHIVHHHQQQPLQDQHDQHQVVVSSHNLINRSEGDQSNSGIDPVSLLKFPVLGNQLLMPLSVRDNPSHNNINNDNNSDCFTATATASALQAGGMRGPPDFGCYEPPQEGAVEYMYAQSTAATDNIASHHYDNPVQLEFLGNINATDENFIDNLSAGDKTIMEGGQLGGGGGGTETAADGKSSSSSKRKRPRTIKTSDEVESQRMTHIAVERNRRKQMNEHLRVLRSLMPSSYVQRGDQASIIGGAIEFVRELEQLLQCLESQKRRRLYGDQQARPMGDTSSTLALVQQPPQSPLGFPCPPPPIPTNLGCGTALGSESASNLHQHQEQVQLRLVDDHPHQLDPSNNHNCSTTTTTVGGGGGLLIQEETAESKSCIADVEVKVLGFDALIKILSRRRPSQLIKAIAALEDLHFTILHTNITTIEQTVLYSFNVKIGSEARFTAEDIASSVQQIFTFIHANTDIS